MSIPFISKRFSGLIFKINHIKNSEFNTRNDKDTYLRKISRESFKEFYRKYSKTFWYFIFKTCGDADLADDIFQESFFRFLRAKPVNLNEHQQKSYLYKVAFRLIIDQKRKIKVEEKIIGEIDFFERKDNDIFLSMDMEKMFNLLKPKERTLLWLAYIEGYTHKDISKIVEVKEKSIKVQLFRVKKKFAEILKQKGYNGRNRHEKN